MRMVTVMQRLNAAVGAVAVTLMLLAGISAVADEQVRAAMTQAAAVSTGRSSASAQMQTRAAPRRAVAQCSPAAAPAG